MRVHQLRQCSIVGLCLFGASFTLSVLPGKPRGAKLGSGNLQYSEGAPGAGAQLTCINGSGAACGYTVTLAHGNEGNCGIDSRTTEDGATSTFTNAICQNGLKTNTIGNKNSSESPN